MDLPKFADGAIDKRRVQKFAHQQFAGSAARVIAVIVLVLVLSASTHLARPSMANVNPKPSAVDTALVVSVDVSSSVNDGRYDLQLEGIATALEDRGVQDAILNGPQNAILFSLVTWSDHPRMDVPWQRIASRDDALRVAALVRKVTRNKGNFTCMGRMLSFLNSKVLARIPVEALRTVVDVSGDGSDNCNPHRSVGSLRTEIVDYGTIINGLPILEGREADTLETWYTDNVKGGLGSFILPAVGFKDFGRAIRQKFVMEISGVAPSGRTLETAAR